MERYMVETLIKRIKDIAGDIEYGVTIGGNTTDGVKSDFKKLLEEVKALEEILDSESELED